MTSNRRAPCSKFGFTTAVAAVRSNQDWAGSLLTPLKRMGIGFGMDMAVLLPLSADTQTLLPFENRSDCLSNDRDPEFTLASTMNMTVGAYDVDLDAPCSSDWASRSKQAAIQRTPRIDSIVLRAIGTQVKRRYAEIEAPSSW